MSDKIMNEMFQKWIGKGKKNDNTDTTGSIDDTGVTDNTNSTMSDNSVDNTMGNSSDTNSNDINGQESNEPYQDIEPVQVTLKSLPIKAKKNDSLDIEGKVISTGKNGYVIELHRLWNKTEE